MAALFAELLVCASKFNLESFDDVQHCGAASRSKRDERVIDFKAVKLRRKSSECQVVVEAVFQSTLAVYERVAYLNETLHRVPHFGEFCGAATQVRVQEGARAFEKARLIKLERSIRVGVAKNERDAPRYFAGDLLSVAAQLNAESRAYAYGEDVLPVIRTSPQPLFSTLSFG